MRNKVCSNKKCQKLLQDGYKYKYCEACRNKYVQKFKDSFKVVEKVVCIGGIVAVVVEEIVMVFRGQREP